MANFADIAIFMLCAEDFVQTLGNSHFHIFGQPLSYNSHT